MESATKSPSLTASSGLAYWPSGTTWQSTITLDGDSATGESYTIAHHVFAEVGRRKIMIASLRYLDTFAKIEGAWYFAERTLILDWSETRDLGLGGPTAA